MQNGALQEVNYVQTVFIFRAVMEAELRDIIRSGCLRNPPGNEVKYFATSETGANRYAQSAFGRFGDKEPYTTIRVEVSSALLTDIVSIESGIRAVVLPSDQLVDLVPEVLNLGLRDAI